MSYKIRKKTSSRVRKYFFERNTAIDKTHPGAANFTAITFLSAVVFDKYSNNTIPLQI